MLLIDTCVLLWLASDQKKLSKAAKEAIANSSGSLFISAISAFEIGIKSLKGKIELPIKAEKWYNKIIDFHGIQEIEINNAIAFRSTQLPRLHNDPCDRFIIATSLLHSMPIITSDKHISQYKEAKIIW